MTAYEPFLQWLLANDPRSLWDLRHRQMAGPQTRPVRTAGLRFTDDVVEGIDAAAVLTTVARNLHADALVIGSRRNGGRHHRRPRAAALQLAARSQLPVIVVPSS